MKKIFNQTIFIIISIAFFAGCVADLPEYFEFTPFEYSKVDETGGNWKTVLITDVNAIQLATPAAIGSSEYNQELSALKDMSQNPSAEQIEAIQYWAGDGIVRWNEIIRAFISKYNLPPAPVDGVYGAPNAANPSAYPNFPFAHPTYACRALAYLSGAQYDAMIVSWHNKFKFNRSAHQKADSSISLRLPATDIPTYPSEGAVIAAVSRVMLTALFPLEKEWIALKVEEHKNSLMWAGKNVLSDIQAGDSLGSIIAAEFLKRASTDGMRNAQTPKPISDSIKQLAIDRFGWSWKNLETPERPVGITPLFGKVKPWFISNIETVRPGPPPAIGSEQFNIAADELKEIAKNLTQEQRAIAYKYSDGISTYSPPGHWNRIAVEDITKNKMNPIRTARVLAYLNYAVMDAGISCWDTKYFYHYPRPSQAIPNFKTLLGIPNFPAYTSGHSTFSSAAATVLSHFFPSSKARFEAIAEEAAISRLYGGIHYRFDSETGNATGKLIGDYSVNVAKVDGVE
ncbi:MAG: phosphatase PAP2 family protein [Saprospiraceae bacterium]|nr:phosphatase PAP2 family protein [Saprospiraceae bacterium]